MQAAGIHHLELTLLFLVLLVAGLTTLAQRFKIPYPIVLFIGGVVLSLFRHLPQIALNPDVVFLVVLPPLLFIGGFNTSWRDFHKNIVSILMLAFGLVGFTVFGVAVGTAWLIPGFDYRLGAVLGAVVSTTDAIAATAIAKRLGLPRRIVDILEGESLVNDASGLLALQFSVALVVAGRRPGPGLAVLELLWLVAGGVAIGLFAGIVIHKVSLDITDSPVEITLSLATPYMAYLAAEGIHASGVLATVVCGLYLGRKSSETLVHQRAYRRHRGVEDAGVRPQRPRLYSHGPAASVDSERHPPPFREPTDPLRGNVRDPGGGAEDYLGVSWGGHRVLDTTAACCTRR